MRAGNALERRSGARALLKRSAFAHGYIHGYEMGYHSGDFDFQMSRNPRELKKVKDYKTGTERLHATVRQPRAI